MIKLKCAQNTLIKSLMAMFCKRAKDTLSSLIALHFTVAKRMIELPVNPHTMTLEHHAI